MTNYHRGAVAMLAEKIIKMFSQLVMLILLARFLGAETLGQLMYCFALSSIFVFLNGLGLDTLLVKRFLDRPIKRLSYLKHALVARCLAAIVCVLLVNVIGVWLVDENSRLLLFVLSMYHMFMPFTVYEWFFQAEGRGDLSALGLIVGHVTAFIFRLSCLYLGGDLIWLGFAYIVEMFAMAISFMAIARQQKVTSDGPVSSERIYDLVKEASPLIISGAIVLLYMKVDQLMLGYMKGGAEVGTYVAATRLSEAWYFVGLTLIGVYFPKLLQINREKGEARYNSEIVGLGRWLVWTAVVLAIVTVFISDWLVNFLYGPGFVQSAYVLEVTIWAVPFVYLGAISTKMYIVDSKHKIILWRSVVGLVLNIVLNVILIDKYGAFGAAIASLVAQVGACYLFNALTRDKKIFHIQSDILFGTALKNIKRYSL